MELVAHLKQTFVTLHDAVEKAIGNTTEFKYLLLQHFKSTLDSLEPRIKQRGEFKLLLNPQLIEKLIAQMHKGIELVRRFSKSSKFHVWKYWFCINDDDYADQLVDLDSYLGRMLEFLWRHEEGRVIDEQFRELTYVAGQVKRRLSLDAVKTLEMEKPLSSSKVETSHQSEEQLVTRFLKLLDVVTVEEKITAAGRCKTLFGDLKSTLQSLKSFVEKLEVLNLPEEELEVIIVLVDKCFELVASSSTGVVLHGSYKKYYTNQLLELNHSLQRELSKLRKLLASILNKELASLRNIEAWISKPEKNTKGTFGTPEYSSPILFLP